MWVDDTNNVVESNEEDNISPGDGTVDIVNTLPDMEVLDWYTVWDVSGDGLLIYDLVNSGASTAPAGWLITLTLSPNDIIGDGDEIFLFGERARVPLDPEDTLYRDDSTPASYSLLFRLFRRPRADGDILHGFVAGPGWFLTGVE